MPHVELVGPRDLTGFHRRFQPRTLREGSTVIKASGCWLSHDGVSLLLECLTVEGYLRQGFFVMAAAHPGGIMVRLSPRTSPEKTDGVKRCVAWVALWLRAGLPEAGIGSTNLRSSLESPLPPEACSL